MTAPRGIRNRNPGNIIVAGWTQRQDGYTGPEPEGRFGTFATMAYGLAALIHLLQNYRGQGLKTVRGIINKWAPPVENDTSAYVEAVAKALGVGVDEELPDEPHTYHSLARAIAAHENGRDAAEAGITSRDYAEAMAFVFGIETVAAAPAPNSEPTFKERLMAAPIVAVLAPLALELLKLLPAFSSGSKVAERNIELAQKIGPKLIDIAKTVVPSAANEQDAVQQIVNNPALKDAFVAAAAVKWDDIEPFLQFEEESRAKARNFVHSMTSTGPEWKQLGAGALIGALSLFIIVGGGFLFWDMMYNPNLDPGQKGLILGALIAAFTTAVGFWFGSSASGRSSGQTVSEIAKRQP